MQAVGEDTSEQEQRERAARINLLRLEGAAQGGRRRRAHLCVIETGRTRSTVAPETAVAHGDECNQIHHWPNDLKAQASIIGIDKTNV